jgi:hypothetical protein
MWRIPDRNYVGKIVRTHKISNQKKYSSLKTDNDLKNYKYIFLPHLQETVFDNLVYLGFKRKCVFQFSRKYENHAKMGLLSRQFSRKRKTQDI